MKGVKTLLSLCILLLPICSIRAGMDNDRQSINDKIAANHLERKNIIIYISKLAHVLELKIGDITLKQYTCVFGGDPVSDKKCEGDKCTPEGIFHVQSKYPHSRWDKFIWIDYPNKESWRKFERNKQLGKVPPHATIGGDIGIHGVPVNRSDLIDRSVNWTLGCISLKDEDINEIYDYVNAGTEVVITK